MVVQKIDVTIARLRLLLADAEAITAEDGRK